MPNPKNKFETERTRSFSSGILKPRSTDTITHIEKFGCPVLSVKNPSRKRALFSYTTGVYDTCGAPELIAVGLDPDVAHSLLNEAVRRLRKGENLTIGRQWNLIGNVDCEFRPVDSKWVEILMLQSNWYYGNSNYPVLQAVYPDLSNRFPEDEGFYKYFSQPLMQPGAATTRVEEDFWAANDPNSSLFDWKFSDDPHTGVYLSKTVNDGTVEVTYVSHDAEDGAWQFLGDSMSDPGGVLSCFHHPVDKDPTLQELVDLPIGWYAEREKPGQPWIRNPIPPRENEPEVVTE
jgi:hypothetical protein